MNSQLNLQTSRVRLVIADVDGTLVTQDKVLTARATEAVKKLHDASILFGITSGRPPKGMKMLIAPLQLTEPLGGFNGGVVVNPDLVPLSKHCCQPMSVLKLGGARKGELLLARRGTPSQGAYILGYGSGKKEKITKLTACTSLSRAFRL